MAQIYACAGVWVCVCVFPGRFRDFSFGAPNFEKWRASVSELHSAGVASYGLVSRRASVVECGDRVWLARATKIAGLGP